MSIHPSSARPNPLWCSSLPSPPILFSQLNSLKGSYCFPFPRTSLYSTCGLFWSTLFVSSSWGVCSSTIVEGHRNVQIVRVCLTWWPCRLCWVTGWLWPWGLPWYCLDKGDIWASYAKEWIEQEPISYISIDRSHLLAMQIVIAKHLNSVLECCSSLLVAPFPLWSSLVHCSSGCWVWWLNH